MLALIADALDYAHRQGVVHRDVNPRNILLDAAGAPHVTDFGLARRAEGSILVTLEGEVLGTPAYMAPEQAAGESAKVDGRSDVYSLGVILYQMLTGEVPFRGNLRMLLHQVQHDEPRPPRRLNDRIPRDLETVCLKALAKEPGRRYATAGDFAADLRRYLDGESVKARPVGQVERVGRWCRRNPVLAGLTAAVAVLLVAVAVGLTVEVFRLQRERDEAERALRRERELLSEASQGQVARGVRLLEEGNSLGLLDLLEARRRVQELPQAAESRSLLWAGWNAACSGRLAQVVGHDGPVRFVAIRPDGKMLATAGDDRWVRLWDPVTGQPLRPPLEHHGQVMGLAFSPGGRFLFVSTLTDPTGRSAWQVWDVITGWAPVQSFPNAELHFSSDGKRLVLIPGDGGRAPVQLYQAVDRWRPAGSPMRVSGGNGEASALSPDAKWLAAGGGNPREPVEVWDTGTGRLHQRLPYPGHLWKLSFSPDGKWLAAAAWDSTARVWDTKDWKPAGPPLRHQEHVRDVAFSPDSTLLATASFDGTVRLWDPAGGQPRSPPWRHQGPVVEVAWSPTGNLLAARSLEGTIRLWDVATARPRTWLIQHQGMVPSWAFSPDGKLLVTASSDGTARLWDLAAGEPEGLILEHPDRVWKVAFSPDGKRLATASEDGAARLWDTDLTREIPGRLGQPSGPPLFHPDRPNGGGGVLAVAFSPDGRWLALVGDSGAVCVWDPATGQMQGKVAAANRDPVRAVVFSPDGQLLAGNSPQDTVRLWRTGTWKDLGVTMTHEGTVEAVAFSPDGKLLASGALDRTARLWDVPTGQPHGRPLRHREWVEAVAFSPDGKLLATASRDLTVRLWDTATGGPHGQPYQQQSAVQALAFSPDGKLLATASADGTARLWDLVTGLPCGRSLPHGGFATSVAFSPDGRTLATGSFDRTARLWPLPGRVTDLDEMERRTWVSLGAWRNERGQVEAIPWKKWQQLRAEFRTR
jgi:WD40 repeat protein